MPVQSLTLWECTNTDAVNFTTAPQYAAPVTKTFAQWGIADNWDFKLGGLKDSATLQFPAGALSTTSPFTFRSKVLIQIDGLNVFMRLAMSVDAGEQERQFARPIATDLDGAVVVFAEPGVPIFTARCSTALDQNNPKRSRPVITRDFTR